MNHKEIRKPRKPGRREHFCLFINEQATHFDPSVVQLLVDAIKKAGFQYTIFEPKSAIDLLHVAETAAGLRRQHPQDNRRGGVTALISCGGDGTFNLVARAALRSGLPIGYLPMGRFNDIARAIYGDTDPQTAVSCILKRKVKEFGTAKVANQFVFGSAAFGFPVQLYKMLCTEKRPRFSMGWGSLASKAITATDSKEMIVKIDAFRFELSTSMVMINLLPFMAGLSFSPISINSGSNADLILDFSKNDKEFNSLIKDLAKGCFDYGSAFRQFRGEQITLQPVKGQELLLDGEIVKFPNDVVQFSLHDKKVKVFAKN